MRYGPYFLPLIFLCCPLLASSVAEPMLEHPEYEAASEDNENPARVFATFDLLYGRSCGEALTVARALTPSTIPDYQSSQLIETGEPWRLAFAVGLGLDLPKDGWMVYGNWQHFWQEQKGSFLTDFPVVVPLLLIEEGKEALSLGAPRASGVDFTSKMVISRAALSLMRRYFIASHFLVAPEFGLGLLFLDERIEADYTTLFGPLITPPYSPRKPLPNESFTGSSTFLGVGPRLGCGMKWLWGGGFGLVGKASGALVWGLSKGNYTIDIASAPAGRTERVREQILPLADIFLGIDWDRRDFAELYHFNFTLGYQTQYIFGRRGIPSVQNLDPVTNSALSAFVFGVRINF